MSDNTKKPSDAGKKPRRWYRPKPKPKTDAPVTDQLKEPSSTENAPKEATPEVPSNAQTEPEKKKRRPRRKSTTKPLTEGASKSDRSTPGTQSETTTKVQNKTPKAPAVREPVKRPESKQTFEQELQQLLIKFPTLQIGDVPAGSKPRSMHVEVPILDPDFPYDLDKIELDVQLPAKYPAERPVFKLLNADIPAQYKTLVEQRLQAYVQSLPSNELCLRPVLRYLENNFEQLITERAASSRFKFFAFPATNVVRPLTEVPLEPSSKEANDDVEDDGESEEFISFGKAPVSEPGKAEGWTWQDPVPMLLQNTSKTNVRGENFYVDIVNAATMGNVGYVYLSALSVSLECQRCQRQMRVANVRAFVDRFEACATCGGSGNKISLLWQPTLMATHGSRLGVLTVSRATPRDLLPSTLQMACLECSHTSTSRDVAMAGWHPGVRLQKAKFPHCFHGFSLDLGQVVFAKQARISTKNKNKPPKDAPLTIGQPLPEKGACEHFQKSFRWYRFPCCHRAFACEHCHLNGSPECATKDPAECHARKFICGFCSREQALSGVKACACGFDWSGGAAPRHSAHWEGGKGCRNTVAMSRKDNRKYKGK